jgi:hypothetical protein
MIGEKMNKNVFTAANAGNIEMGADNNLRNLIQKANEVGILTISAHGGMTENILKDAIKSAEHLNNYIAKHPAE